MSEDFSQFILAASLSRTDAQMAKLLLQESGIIAHIKQDSATEALSVARGNALLPFEMWGLYVKPSDLEEAKSLLSGILFKDKPSKIPETAARRFARPIIWVFLILFFAGILIAFGMMFSEITNMRRML